MNRLNAQILVNQNTGQIYMIDKATGKVYQRSEGKPFGALDPYNVTSTPTTSTTTTNKTWFGSNWNWEAIGNTISDIYENPAVQSLINNVSFDSGQFQFGTGGSTVTTTPPPAPNNAGFGDTKTLLLVGGGILATVAIVALIAKAS